MRGISRGPEVDRDGNAFQLEALAQPVLHPVAVVARHQRWIVHEEAKARWAPARLRAVEEVQPLARALRRLTLLAQLGEKSVQLRGLNARGVLGELALHPV